MQHWWSYDITALCTRSAVEVFYAKCTIKIDNHHHHHHHMQIWLLLICIHTVALSNKAANCNRAVWLLLGWSNCWSFRHEHKSWQMLNQLRCQLVGDHSGPKQPRVTWGAQWRHLMNATEWSMLGWALQNNWTDWDAIWEEHTRVSLCTLCYY